jgi:hypothetical protein
VELAILLVDTAEGPTGVLAQYMPVDSIGVELEQKAFVGNPAPELLPASVLSPSVEESDCQPISTCVPPQSTKDPAYVPSPSCYPIEKPQYQNQNFG